MTSIFGATYTFFLFDMIKTSTANIAIEVHFVNRYAYFSKSRKSDSVAGV